MNTSSLTLQQRMEILTKDFLERDGQRFVRIRRTGRLGWEDTLPHDGAYSSYILESCTQEELISRAYQLACNMITIMDSDKKVAVKITNDQSATDSQTVWVATKVFDEPGLTTGQKLDAFLGFAIHEGCHLLYTDFPVLSQASCKTASNLLNIIEDERIERECGERKPGLVNFVGVTKYYTFDKYYERLVSEGKLENLKMIERFMNCIISYIRYPKSLQASELELFSEQMIRVKEILTPYPSTTKEALDAAEKIYELIKEESKKEQQEKKQTQGGQGADSGKDSAETGENGNPDGSDGGNDVENKLRSMNEKISSMCPDPAQGLGESDQSETLKQDGGNVGRVCEGRLERGVSKGAYIEKSTENRDVYQEALERVRRYVPAISKALSLEGTDFKFCVRGQRTGLLDTSRLAEAHQGVPTVYNRLGELKCTRIAVCILLDESGSMWGPGEMAARDTAILLNEALGKVPNVDLFIYGHTASRSTTSLYVYKEKGFEKRYALGSTESRAGNHDSIAIREAAARVRRHTSDKVLFFMISDGAPNESTELVRKAVQDVEKDGFNLVAISIDPYYDPSTMYDHNVNLSDMSTLAIDLGKIVRKAIKKNTGHKINI